MSMQSSIGCQPACVLANNPIELSTATKTVGFSRKSAVPDIHIDSIDVITRWRAFPREAERFGSNCKNVEQKVQRRFKRKC